MYLAFNQDIDPAITKAIYDNSDDEKGMHLVKSGAFVKRHNYA